MNKYLLCILLLGIGISAYGQPFDNPSLWSEAKLTNVESINSVNEEFSPFSVGNELLYIGRQEKGNFFRKRDTNYFDIKVLHSDAETSIKQKSNYQFLNTNYHEGPLSRYKGTVYFTRANQSSNGIIVDEYSRLLLQIFRADLKNGKWKNVKKIRFSSDEANYCHPTISSNGKLMVFASSKEEGFGKMDLYFAKAKAENQWKFPINIGEDLNTDGNEWFPYLYGNEDLFFAADKGDGNGMDIYYCKIDTFGTIERLARLPYPINTPADDFGIFIDPDGKGGYLSSNRSGGKGKDDIYRILFKDVSLIKPTKTAATKAISIELFDPERNLKLSGATVSIYTLNPSNAASFVHQLTEDSEFSLLEKTANQLVEPEIFKTNNEGILNTNLKENTQYFIVVKYPGFKPDWNYIHTRQNISELLFEMSKE